MPEMNCAVAVCKNNQFKSIKEGKDVSFFTFPIDRRRKIWVLRCKRADQFNPDTFLVCSEHFTDNDFELNFKVKLVDGPTKKKLKNCGKSKAILTID
ncbi:THAP domain-containing protein 5-like [Myzus persicae]|uniref:THAP domain-containing protein 5-like n=1 Tax=Myzus persicae TaxID=13164 RepID=UPI000B932F0C|nr:THAP domain-containing protein 5-like [Myzus persicae]